MTTFGHAIVAIMAKMATLAWPNVVTDMVINGVYAKIRKNVGHP